VVGPGAPIASPTMMERGSLTIALAALALLGGGAAAAQAAPSTVGTVTQIGGTKLLQTKVGGHLRTLHKHDKLRLHQRLIIGRGATGTIVLKRPRGVKAGTELLTVMPGRGSKPTVGYSANHGVMTMTIARPSAALATRVAHAAKAKHAETKKINAQMGVFTIEQQVECKGCGVDGTDYYPTCGYSLYLEYPDVPGATSYDITVRDKHPRVNTTYHLHSPPFQDNVKDAKQAPAGSHLFVGFTSGGGPPPCPTWADFAPRFDILGAVAHCPRGCGKVPSIDPPEDKTKKPAIDLPPLPPATNANSRMISAQSRKDGEPTQVFVTRDGKTYLAGPDATFQLGDIIRTDKNTILSIEFAIGGRVGMAPGSEVQIASERHATDVSEMTGIKLIQNTGKLTIDMLDAAKNTVIGGPKRPALEIQTNGGVFGIKG
jgi:hypothetical protein